MKNILELDLNELISTEIKNNISLLGSQLEKAEKRISEQNNEISALKKQSKDQILSLSLLSKIRSNFAKIDHDKEDGYISVYKQTKQFIYIESLLKGLFGINKEANGWNEGSLDVNLAINFYTQKETVIELLSVLIEDASKEISFIRSFKMPFDYSKDLVIEYVKKPKYNTNGCMFGWSRYWVSAGAGISNMPHDLIMKSPYILEKDVFSILIETIKERRGEFKCLFALPKYNPNITNEQIQELGDCLIDFDKQMFNSEIINSFIGSNLQKLNTRTLDFLFDKVQHDNRFNLLHWEKFPSEYQVKFLKSHPLNFILDKLSHYSCTWTIDQKEQFFRDYFSTKNKNL